jgi:hypothetical protein
MEFTFEGRCILTLDHKQDEKTSKHVSTAFNLAVSKNLDRSQYIGENGLPTKDGSMALTNVFCSALVGNIHQAEQNGFIGRAEHLRYIIKKLEEGCSSIAILEEAEFDKQEDLKTKP